MKKYILLLPAIALFSCSGKEEATAKNKEEIVAVKDTSMACFGDSINADAAIAAELVEMKLGKSDSLALKVSGKILDVCQTKGCWMELDLGNEKRMRVTFKDYAFFVPKNAAGKTAIIEGFAYTDTTSVAMLREYAK